VADELVAEARRSASPIEADAMVAAHRAVFIGASSPCPPLREGGVYLILGGWRDRRGDCRARTRCAAGLVNDRRCPIREWAG
jgi:hypothetical protein